MSEEHKFGQWCIVELFGHQRTAGYVTEQVIAGQGYIRVDTPAVEDQEAFSRLFGPGAIYSIIPTTEEIVRAYAARNVAAPISPYILKLPQLPKPSPDEYDDDGETDHYDPHPDDENPPF